MRTTLIQQTVAVTHEVTSPELVLVAPPEIAAQAREALPDYELDVLSVLHTRLAAASGVAALDEAAEPEWVEGKREATVTESLPSYELERKWPWYELEPEPVDEPNEKRRRIPVFTFAFLAMVLLPVALVLLIRNYG
jgi:hypothetical protein